MAEKTTNISNYANQKQYEKFARANRIGQQNKVLAKVGRNSRLATDGKISNIKDQGQRFVALSKSNYSQDIKSYNRSIFEYANRQQTASVSTFD